MFETRIDSNWGAAGMAKVFRDSSGRGLQVGHRFIDHASIRDSTLHGRGLSAQNVHPPNCVERPEPIDLRPDYIKEHCLTRY